MRTPHREISASKKCTTNIRVFCNGHEHDRKAQTTNFCLFLALKELADDVLDRLDADDNQSEADPRATTRVALHEVSNEWLNHGINHQN